MQALLELRNLACERGGRTLFDGVNLRLPAGGLLRVRGANGAGKTSLLRMLCGLLQPSRGDVLWRGEAVSALREEFGRELVYLGHAAALKDDLSPLENLLDACRFGGFQATEDAALRALAQAGLRGHEDTQVRRLSQGQRRRSALARLAVAPGRAALWVLDEPFNALDVGAVAWLGGLVQAHLLAGGLAVLTSHQDVAIDGVAPQELSL